MRKKNTGVYSLTLLIDLRTMLSVSPNTVDLPRGRRQTRDQVILTVPPVDYDFLRAWERCQSVHDTRYINPFNGTWVKVSSKTHNELKSKYTEELSKAMTPQCINCGIRKAIPSHCANCIGLVSYHIVGTQTLTTKKLSSRSRSRDPPRKDSPKQTNMSDSSDLESSEDSLVGTREKNSLSRSAPLPRREALSPPQRLPVLYEEPSTRKLTISPAVPRRNVSRC